MSSSAIRTRLGRAIQSGKLVDGEAGVNTWRETVARILLLSLGLSLPIEKLTCAEPPRKDRYGDTLPSAAVARLGTVRFRHPGSSWESMVESVFFTPDSKTLITSDDRVYFWSIPDGKETRRLENQGTWLDLAPDGKLAAARTENGVKLVEVASGNLVRKLSTNKGVVHAAAFSPDGKVIAVEDKGQVAILDVETGKLQIRLGKPDERGFNSLSFSRDGKRLAAGCGDMKSRVWDVKTGNMLREASGHLATLSPDGKILVSYWKYQILSSSSVSVTNVDTGRDILRPEDLGDPWGVPLFSQDGKSLLVPVFPEQTIVLDLATGKQPATIDGCIAAVSPDGKMLAVWSGGRAFRLIDARTYKEIQPRAGHRQIVHCVAFAPDSQTVATTGDGHHLRLWNGQTGEVLREIDLHPPDDVVYRAGEAGFSREGKFVATLDCMGEGGVALWDTYGKELSLWKEKENRYTAAWHFLADGKMILLASGGTLRLRDIVRKTESRNLALAPVAGIKVSTWDVSAFSPDGSLLIQAASHEIKDRGSRTTGYGVWDAATGKLIRTIIAPDKLDTTTALAVSADNRMLATSVYKAVYLWDLQTGKEVRKFTASPWRTPVAFSTDGRLLAYAGPDDAIRIVKTMTGQELRVWRGHLGPITSLAFSPDGKRLVSGSDDSTALVWDLTQKLPPER